MNKPGDQMLWVVILPALHDKHANLSVRLMIPPYELERLPTVVNGSSAVSVHISVRVDSDRSM
jgi:hypothetical protein